MSQAVQPDPSKTEAKPKTAVDQPLKQGKGYRAAWQAAPPRVKVAIGREFAIEQWSDIEALYQQQEGRVNWQFDVSEMALLPSRLMGLFIGLHTILTMHGGGLEIVTRENSSVAVAIKQSRVDRVMTVIEK